MARIAGVDLPRERRVEIGLTYIYGIGLKSSQKILSQTGINPDTRVKDLTEADVSKLKEKLSPLNTQLKVTLEDSWLLTSRDLWKSDVTEVSVTEEVFL